MKKKNCFIHSKNENYENSFDKIIIKIFIAFKIFLTIKNIQETNVNFGKCSPICKLMFKFIRLI